MSKAKELENINLMEYFNCLKHKAFKIKDSKKRRHPRMDPDMEGYDYIISPPRLDFEAILESKAIRRLRHKAQVFPTPENEHIRTRDIHTFEVLSFCRKVSKIMGLNVDLTEAIALGHDIGHPPFGHIGEDILSMKNDKNKPFHHSVFGVVIAQKFERGGLGLNLIYETLFGIINHTDSNKGLKLPENIPEEFLLVRNADKIAYVFSDSNDIKRFDFLTAKVTKELNDKLNYFGKYQRERMRTCINALVEESAILEKVSFKNSKTAKNFLELKKWLFENVYKKIPRDNYQGIIGFLFESLGNFFGFNPTNHIALMTDTEAVYLYNKLLSKPKIGINNLKNLSFMETVSSVANPEKIKYYDPDLGWAD